MNFTKLITSVWLMLWLATGTWAQMGYNIHLKVKGYANKEVQFAYYFADKQYVVNSATMNAKGEVDFKGDEPLPGGLYLMVLVDKKDFFDVLIDEDQKFSMTTDTTNLQKNMKVKGSVDNEAFFSYQQGLLALRDKRDAIEKEQELHTANADSAKILSDQLDVMDEEMKAFWKSYTTKYEGTFFAKMLVAMNLTEEEIGQIKDPNYLRQVDLSDSRFLRTPLVYKAVRLNIAQTINLGVPKIIETIDGIIEKSKVNDDMFHYISGYCLNFYSTFAKVGMNEVFVHLAEKYFLSNEKLDSAAQQSLQKRVDKVSASFIGKTCPNLRMASIQGDTVSLHSVDAKYTVLFFWKTGCGHCTEAAKTLGAFRKEINNPKSLEVFAVYIRDNKKDWQQFLDEQDMNDFVNVFDPKNETDYRETFYVFSTPIMFLLDEDKKIIAKRVGPEQIKELAEQLLAQRDKF